MPRRRLLLSITALLSAFAPAQRRPMTWRDVMQFQAIESPTISADGTVVAYEARPDRGDSELVVTVTHTGAVHRIGRGHAPEISADARFVACRIAPPFDAAASDEPGGAALLEIATGEVERLDGVERVAFSADGSVLVTLRPARDGAARGRTLSLRGLTTPRGLTTVFGVTGFALAKDAPRVVYAIARDDERDALLVRDLCGGVAGDATVVHEDTRTAYRALTFRDDGAALAFVHAPRDGVDRVTGEAVLALWRGDGPAEPIADSTSLPDGLAVAADAQRIRFSRSGGRVGFGVRTRDREDRLRAWVRSEGGAIADPVTGPDTDPFDVETVRAARGVDVWHGRDRAVVPEQKQAWKAEVEQTFAAVHDLTRARNVVLADATMPDVDLAELDARFALGRSDVAFRRASTWDGPRADVFVVDLASGARSRILEAHDGRVTIAPDGRTVAFWRGGDWHLLETGTGRVRNVTADLGVSFADELWDYPGTNPGYAFGGFLADGLGALIHDRFDVWLVPTRGGAARCLTAGHGRRLGLELRVLDTDREDAGLAVDAPILLQAHVHATKETGFAWTSLAGGGVRRTPLAGLPANRRFVARATTSGSLLLTAESYDRFPDLWVTDAGLTSITRVSDLDRQRAPFAWGTSRLVTWQSTDGVPLQGALIVPDGYQEGTRLPVLVYFYRFFSQRVHEFNQPRINHRPCFPLYAGDGYAIFLPDVRFEVGRPGESAVECVVPGVDRLVELGVADPRRIALHGHSWSGYQTAFAITRTDRFACAIAGAPVSNMTSAYGGIRLESGMARQFQYEQTQSRIGASLWERRDLYIENSPLFFADRVHTPTLILFGDADGAVPWQQGIELYLGLRRLDKDVVMVTYRGEPHHPQLYANKLDWAIKMREYLDHHLRGAAAAPWMVDGAPYAGR